MGPLGATQLVVEMRYLPGKTLSGELCLTVRALPLLLEGGRTIVEIEVIPTLRVEQRLILIQRLGLFLERDVKKSANALQEFTHRRARGLCSQGFLGPAGKRQRGHGGGEHQQHHEQPHPCSIEEGKVDQSLAISA